MTKPVSARMKIDALLWLALVTDYQRFKGNHHDATNTFNCPGCNLPIMAEEEIQWDHGVPDGLGGAHNYKNIRPMHKECHRKKTSGTKATSAGSDVHMIAKAKRIAKGGKKRRGPKIKSRPFPKGGRKYEWQKHRRP